MTINLIFFGTPEFSVPTLEALLSNPRVSVKAAITQPDKPAGRGGKIQSSPIKCVAREHGVPVLQPVSIRKDPDFIAQLQQFGPLDVNVVIAFGQILPVSVLDLPHAGSINIHASILPRWRGAAPIHRSIMAGDRETGVCLMKMEAGLDTGPVYSVATTPIRASDTTGDLHDRLARLGAELLTRDLESIAGGKISSVPQPEEGVTYAAKITTEEARIEWSRAANDLDCTIRGLSPFPGAWTMLDGKRFKIFLAAPTPTPYRSGNAGEVVFVAPDRLEIACGSGALRLLDVQLEGKKRTSIQDFLRGFVVRDGLRLGN